MGKSNSSTSATMPKGYTKSSSPIQHRLHFDTVNPILAEEHYGKYLIGKHTKKTIEAKVDHRIYLCYDSKIEQLRTERKSEALMKVHGISSIYLLTHFPQHEQWLKKELPPMTQDLSIEKINIVLRSIHFILSILEEHHITLSSLEQIKPEHIEIIKKDAKNGTYSLGKLKDCSETLKLIKSYFNKSYTVPNLRTYAVKSEDKTELSLEVTWQLDHFACKELDETIALIKEYQGWMKELKDMQTPFTQDEIDFHGGLFTLKNLIFTYFDNIVRTTKVGQKNYMIRAAAKALYGIELKVYKNHSKATKQEREAIARLKEQGKGGINITIEDERMFAMWLKAIAPKFPYDKSVPKRYQFIGDNLDTWRKGQSKKEPIDLSRLNRRIFVSINELYPLYLLSLCRSGLNQQPVKDWKVLKDKKGIRHFGEESGMGRLVDGFKGRGNSIQTTSLDKEHAKYIDFFIEHQSELYEKSQYDNLFQYFNNQGNKSKQTEEWSVLTYTTLRNIKQSENFFTRNEIIDTVLTADGEYIKKRIEWIDHNQIRKVKNLSEFLQGKKDWERQFNKGHKDKATEDYYRNSQFKSNQDHRIAKTLNQLTEFAKNRASQKDNPKFKVFTKTPFTNCSNPFEPNYDGAKPMKDGDVCANWAKCLSGCSQSKPVKAVHAPNIMAWINVMEELKNNIYTSAEEWESKFMIEHAVAKSTLEGFHITHEEKDLFEKKALEPRRLDFMRAVVLNSKRSVKATEEAIMLKKGEYHA